MLCAQTAETQNVCEDSPVIVECELLQRGGQRTGRQRPIPMHSVRSWLRTEVCVVLKGVYTFARVCV